MNLVQGFAPGGGLTARRRLDSLPHKGGGSFVAEGCHGVDERGAAGREPGGG